MDVTIQKSTLNKQSKITITGSKSESNRLLLLQALYPSINIENLSNSDDSVLMQKALKSSENVIDIHHAGTAMRFLTAFFATQQNREVVLTGSNRMQERPIQTLVEALNKLGADINYEKNEGFPPLRIRGKALSRHQVTLMANISSQYISALLLIAPKLKNGLELTLDGEITSLPYIQMTLTLLSQIGVEFSFIGNVITVKPTTNNQQPTTIIVESDWSSASYFYSMVAMSAVGTEIILSSYKKNSLQGDAVLAEIYEQFGVATSFLNNSISIKKSSIVNNSISIELDLSKAPDIAQTIAVTCLGLGLECHLTGLHTLKIKETDRLEALKTEIEKFGSKIEITANSLHLKSNTLFLQEANSLPLEGLGEAIATYNDHRMAMAFAPLALKVPIEIKDASVVSKSYPSFWNDLKAIGFKLNK